MSPSVSVRLLLTQSDARLVELARVGHERAFEALVQRYRRPLLGYCRRLLLPNERAEDALQQGLLQAWLALREGAEVHHFKPWLYRIVHNAALNSLRVSGYDYAQLSETLSGVDAPVEDLDRRIAVREALAGLAALPQIQREALLRTAIEGRSYRDAAATLGLTEPALRGLVHRARTALRTAMTALTPAPLLSRVLGAGGTQGPLAGRLGDASAASVSPIGRLLEVGAGGGSAGLAGVLLKSGAAVLTVGALVGGVRLHNSPAARARAHPRPVAKDVESAPAGASRAAAVGAGTRAGGSSVARTTASVRPWHHAQRSSHAHPRRQGRAPSAEHATLLHLARARPQADPPPSGAVAGPLALREPAHGTGSYGAGDREEGGAHSELGGRGRHGDAMSGPEGASELGASGAEQGQSGAGVDRTPLSNDGRGSHGTEANDGQSGAPAGGPGTGEAGDSGNGAGGGAGPRENGSAQGEQRHDASSNSKLTSGGAASGSASVTEAATPGSEGNGRPGGEGAGRSGGG
jgi:RNA polymerase sigma factor (sigma-70 family)